MFHLSIHLIMQCLCIIFVFDCCTDSTFVAPHSVFLIKASHLHISFVMTIQRPDQVDCEFPMQCPSINCAHCYPNKLTNYFNPLMPNGRYSGLTTLLTSRRCILNIYSTNIRTEYFKHAA
jgi:hypothetical protein